jgi:hypothetical protein
MNPIPFLDLRRGGPVLHAQARAGAAAALRNAALGVAAPLGGFCLPPIDRAALRWLRRSASVYRDELEHVAGILGFPGAMTLNLSYLFACTTQAYEDADGLPRLRRTLDWPFRGLGEAVEIGLQAGPAGAFYNATWPGAVGVLTAMAPGRFCAAINQAPMRRRTTSRVGFAWDAVQNMRGALAGDGDWPPDHLLRYAFETCDDFEAALRLIATAPLARPTLFTIAGAKRGELALIERTERDARVYRGPAVVANDWRRSQPGWQPRMTLENNVRRIETMRAAGSAGPRFDWIRKPVLNRLTRLAVEMSAVGDGDFAARGYECSVFVGEPVAVTEDFVLGAQTPACLAA